MITKWEAKREETFSKEKLAKQKGQSTVLISMWKLMQTAHCHATGHCLAEFPGLWTGTDIFDWLAVTTPQSFPELHKMGQKATKHTEQPQESRGYFFNSCSSGTAGLGWSFRHIKRQNNYFLDTICSFLHSGGDLCYKKVSTSRTRPSGAIPELLSYHLR